MNNVRHYKQEDPSWKDRVTICAHDFKRMNPTEFEGAKKMELIESTTPWFKMLNKKIVEIKTEHMSVREAVNISVNVNKKLPPLPEHNMFYVERTLKQFEMESALDIFQENNLYSVVCILMNKLLDDNQLERQHGVY